MTSRRGWGRVDWLDWTMWREHICGVTEWHPTMVLHDLRFWNDPIACGALPRPPVSELAACWAWSRSRAHRAIQCFDSGREPPSAWGWPAAPEQAPEPPKPKPKTKKAPSPVRDVGEAQQELVEKGDPAQRVWEFWNQQVRPSHVRDAGSRWHQARKLTASDRRLVEARMSQDGATEEECLAVVEHTHTSRQCRFLQGENPQGKVYLGLSTLFKAKGWSDRVEAAMAFKASGDPRRAQRRGAFISTQGDAPPPITPAWDFATGELLNRAELEAAGQWPPKGMNDAGEVIDIDYCERQYGYMPPGED